MRGGKFPKERKEKVKSPNTATQWGGGTSLYRTPGLQIAAHSLPAASVSHWGKQPKLAARKAQGQHAPPGVGEKGLAWAMSLNPMP